MDFRSYDSILGPEYELETIIPFNPNYEFVKEKERREETGGNVANGDGLTLGHQIVKEMIQGICISTVFIPAEHPCCGEDDIWETMIFSGKYDGLRWTYPDKETALKGHEKLCRRVRRSLLR